MEESTAAAYHRFLSLNDMRDTKQRRLIFETFVEQTEHLTAEELYHILQKKLPQIGQATVYRTLKLLCDNGFACELSLRPQGSGHAYSSYFEPVRQHEHHDHLACLECGKILEFRNEVVENLQMQIAADNSFALSHHTHVLYGKCKECRAKNNPDA